MFNCRFTGWRAYGPKDLQNEIPFMLNRATDQRTENFAKLVAVSVVGWGATSALLTFFMCENLSKL